MKSKFCFYSNRVILIVILLGNALFVSQAQAPVFHEVEIGVSYQSDMTPVDIIAFDLQAVVDRANEILCGTDMDNIPVFVIKEIITGQNDYTVGNSEYDMIFELFGHHPFSIEMDKALYVTKIPIEPFGTSNNYLYGFASVGTVNFAHICKDRYMGIVANNTTEIHAQSFIRFFGSGFAVLQNASQGVYHSNASSMTSVIDPVSAARLSEELPKTSNGNTDPPCLTVIAGTQGTYYADTDLDGFGDPTNSILACNASAGFVLNNLDCDDSNSSIYLGATEVCGNGVDDDCDGMTDEGCITYPCDSYANPTTYTDNAQLPGATIRVSENLILNGFSLSQFTNFFAGNSIELKPGYDSGVIGNISEYDVQPCE